MITVSLKHDFYHVLWEFYKLIWMNYHVLAVFWKAY